MLEPVVEIGQLIRERCPAALFHTDATQDAGKIPIDLQGRWQDVDLLSFAAHKFHGPKGVGGLYIRPGFELEPMIVGRRTRARPSRRDYQHASTRRARLGCF